jgi:hypothetical protein
MIPLMKLEQLCHIKLSYLLLILSGSLLILIHLLILPLLFSVIDQEMSKLLVDFLPHVVLSEGNHGSRLGRFSDLSPQTGDIICFKKFFVELIGCKEVTFIVREDGHVVLQNR